MNNNALTIPNDNEFNIIEVIARRAASCGLYGGIGNEHKIFMILLAARELGVKPMEALNGGIWNIQGKIEISARLMSSMIRRAGHSINIIQCDSKACILEGKRKDNGDTFKSQFTIEDAEKAGLVNRDVWKKFTEDMLYSRALSRLARRLFADVIGSAYVEGELRDVKCEVISNEIVTEQPITPEMEEANLCEFLTLHPEEDQQLIRNYLNKYASHWKKTITESINHYHDKDKFEKDFGKFKKRELENQKTLAIA